MTFEWDERKNRINKAKHADKIPPMTSEEVALLEKTPIVYDKDSPKLTRKQLSQFVPYYLANSMMYKPRKADVHLKIDIDVLEAFKAQGKGYQTRINEVLRNHVFGHQTASRQKQP